MSKKALTPPSAALHFNPLRVQLERLRNEMTSDACLASLKISRFMSATGKAPRTCCSTYVFVAMTCASYKRSLPRSVCRPWAAPRRQYSQL